MTRPTEPLIDVCRAHAPQWARVNARATAVPTPLHDPASPDTDPHLATVPLAPPQPATRALALAAARRAQRLATDEQVWTSPRQGWTLDAMAHHQLAPLTTQAPELAEAGALAQDFASLIRQRQPAPLEPWLVRASTSRLPPCRRFAKGRRADLAAVEAAVTRPWRQGPIEGQSNRLKRLTRHMFGRARLDLLARRFLLAA